MAAPAVAFPQQPLPRQLAWWTLAFPVALVLALALHSLYLLNWVHVLAGTLWTGADIFMGFVLGPVLKRLEVPQRTAVIAYLVPRTLLYFPMLSLTASTAGWLLSDRLGWLDRASPEYAWIVGALVLVTLMTIQGLGVLLPNSLRIWFELQKPAPDRKKIVALNRINIWKAASQGVMQVTIILVMAHFAFP